MEVIIGLDMYLNAKRYLWAWPEDGADVKIAAEIGKMVGTDLQVKGVTVEVGYWRKANAIHDWFVKNVQDGKDECVEHYVDRDQLMELRSLCEQVLADPKLAPELLPTASGFFFGSTEYDEWYIKDLQHTLTVIDAALALDAAQWDIYYDSSW